MSHDLKTPITRLRLRAEMLDDAIQRERFCASLDELDTLVKGALASVRGLDLDETLETVDVYQLLVSLAEELKVQGAKSSYMALPRHSGSSRYPSNVAWPTFWKTPFSMENAQK
ncbi:ATP-binding protein [Modicisalibacter luteus]|uniref:hypothetical protein n=1 Tax=Modicisalibacter luteus TaxID=453962 RepID=UPI0036317FC0